MVRVEGRQRVGSSTKPGFQFEGLHPALPPPNL